MFLVLLDVEKAFEGLPHSTIRTALDRCCVTGSIRAYLDAFLSNRRLQVRVAKTLSSVHPVTAGVPQGSVLSPFLFNLALATLPDALPTAPTTPVQISLYADDIALWCTAPTGLRGVARNVIQHALNTVDSRLQDLGLKVSPTKSVALMYHPTAGQTKRTAPLTLAGEPLPWQRRVVYLGATLDCRLNWREHLKSVRSRINRAQQAIQKLVARGRGCSPELAVRIYMAIGAVHVMYALSQASLTTAAWKKLELQHNASLRLCLGLPRQSKVASTLAEAGALPLRLQALRQGLNFVARLKLAPDGQALLERFRARPHSQAAKLLGLYEEVVGPEQPAAEPLPPPALRGCRAHRNHHPRRAQQGLHPGLRSSAGDRVLAA